MRCLIIDNYDSFTWNLADFVAQTFGHEPVVVRNDQYSWQEISQLDRFDSIIVSPGPGSVTHPSDFNVSREALLQDKVPVLGVCLGFQGLAHVYGGEIRHAPVPFHGRKSIIRHDCCDLFVGLPEAFDAVRYHSLIVAPETLPSVLQVTARSKCGLLMGLRHVSLPKWGIQFHPESILTAHGKRMVANFRDLACRHAGLAPPAPKVSVPAPRRPAPGARPLKMLVRKLVSMPPAEAVFKSFYAEEKNAFWLDSQVLREGMSRFSFMGCAADDAVLSFSLTDTESLAHGREYLSRLEKELESAVVDGDEELPFEFKGGYVGFMSYEMKSVFGAPTSHANSIPDSVWMRADRFIALDHLKQRTWLVALAAAGDDAAAEAWMDDITARMHDLHDTERQPNALGLSQIRMQMNFGREGYLEAIERCKEKIVDGESYEVCLTNGFSFDARLDPLDLYLVMRRENAAPFGAFIRSGDFCILSTSPERFLKTAADGRVQTKPIKGTCARSDNPQVDRANAQRLAASEKDQAENLMIVDLMRNDLGRVSVPGSVSVPKLMDIESYKTVHQMVSTVESVLKPECTLIDLLRAVFPGGSITGAPKIRTMEIIDALEPGPRGVYCGTIGYLGYNRIADLNIAIRSLSYDGRKVQFGAGGAVTFLSDPDSEFEEILLKAESVLRPIWHYLSRPDGPFEYRLVDRQLCMEETESPAIAG